MSHLETTRLSLHAVAELLMAGPQYAQSGSIELRVAAGGFATVAAPDVRVAATYLMAGERGAPLDGRTVAELGEEVGIEPRSLDDVYTGGPGLTVEHRLRVDEQHAAEIGNAFRVGDEALAAFAPEAHRVLWPEHFDIGITVDEVNYGVSPGDSYLGVPYAYVGPWTPAAHVGPFWNAPFGAARPVSALGDAAEVRAFFDEGRRLVAGA